LLAIFTTLLCVAMRQKWQFECVGPATPPWGDANWRRFLRLFKVWQQGNTVDNSVLHGLLQI
jgi:hypothetical protein